MSPVGPASVVAASGSQKTCGGSNPDSGGSIRSDARSRSGAGKVAGPWPVGKQSRGSAWMLGVERNPARAMSAWRRWKPMTTPLVASPTRLSRW